MANVITLTVMGGSAAPYNASGPAGNPWGNVLGGVANGISEQMQFEVVNLLRVNAYIQPTSGTTYPAVGSVVRYKSVNNTSGKATVVRMFVNETPSAIKTASNT